MKSTAIIIAAAAVLAGPLSAAHAAKIVDMERMRGIVAGAGGAELRSDISDMDRSFGFSSSSAALDHGYRTGSWAANLSVAFYSGQAAEFNEALAGLTREVEGTKAPKAFGERFVQIRGKLASGQPEQVTQGIELLLNDLPEQAGDPRYRFGVAVGFHLDLLGKQLQANVTDVAKVRPLVDALADALTAAPDLPNDRAWLDRIKDLVAYCQENQLNQKTVALARQKRQKVKESR